MTTSAHGHVALWIDQNEAHVYRVDQPGIDESTFRAPHHRVHRHSERLADGHEDPALAKRFFDEIARALEAAAEVLVVGPSTAKLHFMKYMHAHDPKLFARVVGVETVDHPTDGQIVAFARTYFDRVRHVRAPL